MNIINTLHALLLDSPAAWHDKLPQCSAKICFNYELTNINKFLNIYFNIRYLSHAVSRKNWSTCSDVRIFTSLAQIPRFFSTRRLIISEIYLCRYSDTYVNWSWFIVNFYSKWNFFNTLVPDDLKNLKKEPACPSTCSRSFFC